MNRTIQHSDEEKAKEMSTSMQMMHLYGYHLFQLVFSYLECPFFQPHEFSVLKERLSAVSSMDGFMANFDSCFKCSTWIEAIDFKKFHISGGCILHGLRNQMLPGAPNTPIDINFNGDSLDEFEDAVLTVFYNLASVLLKKGQSYATLNKTNDGAFSVQLPFDVKLLFIFKDIPGTTDPVSYVLHSSDIDISQIAFTGQKAHEKRNITEHVPHRYAHLVHIRIPSSNGYKLVFMLHDARKYG
jgi:hypothetical protein